MRTAAHIYIYIYIYIYIRTHTWKLLFYKKVNKHKKYYINPLEAELIPICHQLTLLTAHHILHVSRFRVKMSMPFTKLMLNMLANVAWRGY
jgi:hypothetical protein